MLVSAGPRSPAMSPRPLAAVALSSLALWAVAQAPPKGALVFVGARVLNGSGAPPIEGATLIVRDGRVEALGPGLSVPAGSERVDARGKTIIPGLINAHGHVGETRGLRSAPENYTRENVLAQLRLYARYGVTTVVSLGGDRDEGFELRSEQERPGLDRARLFVAGPVIASRTAAEAREAVRALAPKKPDFVKI